MDIDRLRYFCTVARVGSIRGAAKVLKISPAALSKAIKTLEEELGLALLVQSGRGIRVSDERALVRDANAPAGLDEQGQAELLFQGLDGFGKGRRGDLEDLGGAADRSHASDGAEVAETIDVHQLTFNHY